MIMSDSGPLVCIVISTLNACKNLQGCLDSVYAQENPSWEIIIVDGGSRDGTQDIIKRNASRLAYWISEPDKGVFHAWNKALPHVSARWVIFLGSDDRFWDARTIDLMVPTLTDSTLENRIVYGRVAFTNEQDKVLRWEGVPWPKISRRFQREMCIPHQGVFHHKELFANKNGFDTSFRYAGDYEFLLREVSRVPPLFRNVRVASWRQGGLTSNPGQSIQVLKEFRIARIKNGIVGRHPWWSETKARIKYRLQEHLGSRATNAIATIYNRVRP